MIRRTVCTTTGVTPLVQDVLLATNVDHLRFTTPKNASNAILQVAINVQGKTTALTVTAHLLGFQLKVNAYAIHLLANRALKGNAVNVKTAIMLKRVKYAKNA